MKTNRTCHRSSNVKPGRNLGSGNRNRLIELDFGFSSSRLRMTADVRCLFTNGISVRIAFSLLMLMLLKGPLNLPSHFAYE